MERTCVARLDQYYGWGRSQHVEITEDEARLVYRFAANRSSRTVPLEWVDLHETEARVYPPALRWAGLGAVLAAGAFLAAGIEWGAPWLGLGAVAGAAAALAGVAYTSFGYDARYFYHSYNGEFLFALRLDRPNTGAVGKFLETLRLQCERKRERTKFESEMPSIAAEIHHWAELKEKRVISDEEFRVKKESLIEDLLRE